MITQPCPAIVTYCEIYRHDLLDRLSPVHSPMACASVYMKNYEGITDSIAAISPCVAKAVEFEETGVAQYNVTFIKLREYMEKNEVDLQVEETDFDNDESGVGSLFPMPGGLKENIEFFTGKKYDIDKSEGFEVYENLNAYAQTPDKLLPAIFDVLNCKEGCNAGTASEHDKTIFMINDTMRNSRNAALNNRGKEYFDALHKKYDETFELSHFLREYSPIDSDFPKIDDECIQKGFELMDKDGYEKQHIDCGACGSETCYGMARKIALNVNIPSNCLARARDTARELASKDSLTNIFNRRSFMELSLTQIDRMMRADTRGFICIFDLDHFKKVNDTYGHLAGDKVLQDVVQRAKKVTRTYDLLGRYGGEEFILFLFEINDANAVKTVERIRRKIYETPVIFEGQEIPITSSFGIAPVNNMDLKSAIQRADEALYTAKNTGRNKVVLYEEKAENLT